MSKRDPFVDRKRLDDLMGLEAKICDLHRWAHLGHKMVCEDIDSPDRQLGYSG